MDICMKERRDSIVTFISDQFFTEFRKSFGSEVKIGPMVIADSIVSQTGCGAKDLAGYVILNLIPLMPEFDLLNKSSDEMAYSEYTKENYLKHEFCILAIKK